MGRPSAMRRSEVADCCVSWLIKGNVMRISCKFETAWRQRMENMSRKASSLDLSCLVVG